MYLFGEINFLLLQLVITLSRHARQHSAAVPIVQPKYDEVGVHVTDKIPEVTSNDL